MSPLEAMRAVMASQLPATERHVLTCWASHIGAETGIAWPSAPTLADETGMTERGVRNLLQSLEARGVLVLVGRTAQGGKRHRMDIEALAGVEPAPKQRREAPRNRVQTPEPASPPEQHSGVNSIPDPPEQHSGPPRNSIPGTPEQHSDEEEKKGKDEEAIEEERPPAVLALVEPTAEPVDDWTTLAATYGSLPGCIRPAKRHIGNGAALRKLLDHHGAELAAMVLRWWAYDSTPGGRAAYLRENGHKLPTLVTGKNLDAYAEMAMAWDRAGAPGSPEAVAEVRSRTRSFAEQQALDLAAHRARRNNPHPLGSP